MDAERLQRPLVLDGGLASQLERHGADLRDELWSARVLLDDPELIRTVHLEYFAAGAEVATSASYQASFEGFERRGLDPREAAALMRRSVQIAREAADEHAERSGTQPLVAASIGPYGAVLADGSEYDGRYGKSASQLIEFHRPRLEVLLSADPDLLAIETIPSVIEAEALVMLLSQYPESRAWFSFTCGDRRSLHDGTLFAEASAVVASSDQVLAVGVNCSAPNLISSLLTQATDVDKPLVAYPNLGAIWDGSRKTWRAEGPRPDFGKLAAEWREAGATLVGGCCGTGPEDIAAMTHPPSPPTDFAVA
jgi:homocysteine S-methyltransferase